MGVGSSDGRSRGWMLHNRINGRTGRGGFSILEILIATVAALIIFSGVISSLFASSALLESSRETAVATDAVSSTIARISDTAFDQVFAAFNASTADDFLVTGPVPGADFDVPGLDPLPDDPDGRVGRVQFPGDDFILREDHDDPGLGMPRDLDLDGAVDALDHSVGYRVLPVRVSIEWQGQGGRRRTESVTTLVNL